jgi:7-cyano-7-deazaguanine synthase
MIDSIAIVSGGMDSVTLLHFLVRRLHRNPAVLTFTYGQKHTREIKFARAQAAAAGCTDHQVVDLSLMAPVFQASALVAEDQPIPDVTEVAGDPQPVTYVPNRNMIFIAIAAALAETRGVDEVYYGAQAHDLYGYWDTTPKFLGQMNALLGLNRKNPVRVLAPFIHYSKTDLLKAGLELGVDYSQTWSCYAGGEVACGRCPTCAERLQAFENLGLADPLPYQTD